MLNFQNIFEKPVDDFSIETIHYLDYWNGEKFKIPNDLIKTDYQQLKLDIKNYMVLNLGGMNYDPPLHPLLEIYGGVRHGHMNNGLLKLQERIRNLTIYEFDYKS